MKVFRYMKIWLMLLRFRLSASMMYGFNFWSSFFINISIFLIQLIVFLIITAQVDSFNGWNRFHMIFFMGTFTIFNGLYMAFYYFGVTSLPELIRTGKLDLYITKPVSTIFLVSFEKIDLGAAFLAVPGTIMLVYGANRLGIAFSPLKIAVYIFLLMLMLLLMYDLMMILRIFGFWLVKADSLSSIENELEVFSFRVPGTMFRGISKIIFYVILPYGLMATIPTQYFTDYLDMKHWILTLSVCTGFTILCCMLWKTGLSRYESASS